MKPNHPIVADYIIAGTGCAGLSLAIQLKRSGISFAKVILIDKEPKNKNDRTWCFWTAENKNWFDDKVFKKWDRFEFRSKQLKQPLSLNPYSYQMIRSIDFYSSCIEELKQDKRFEFINDEIISISGNDSLANVVTRNASFEARFLFNSVVQTLEVKDHHVNYVQHFKGWLIETHDPVFDESLPVFMDFQMETGMDCRFFYVIPYSETKALFEYTGFSKEAWKDSVYEKALTAYLETNFKGVNFTIVETEKGKIPMFESSFVNPYGNSVVNIGTVGGNSKPSTGYTFYFVQKHTAEIIQALRENSIPSPFLRSRRFKIYDKILLDVLNRGEISASSVFSSLFKKNKVQDIFAFLNEESTVYQEFKIMCSVQKVPFLKAVFRKLLSA